MVLSANQKSRLLTLYTKELTSFKSYQLEEFIFLEMMFRFILCTGMFLSAMVGFAQNKAAIQVYSLSDYQQRVQQKNDTLYVVNMWATWCKPCVEELPYFDSLSKEWTELPVKFIWVSHDAKSRIQQVADFMDKNNYHSEVFILSAGNPNVWIDAIEPKWSGSIPATILYKNGKKTAFYEGDFPDKKTLTDFIHDKQ